jgi:hypothetical protein
MKGLIMTWNHRVVRFNDEAMGEYYEIKEVFYDKEGGLSGYSDATIMSDSFEGLHEQIDMFKTATSKPVLNEADFFTKDSS